MAEIDDEQIDAMASVIDALDSLQDKVLALRAGLANACGLLGDPHSTLDHGRTAGGVALLAVIDFVHSIPETAQLSAPLTRLRDALLDVARGTPHELFRPSSPSNRPPEPVDATKLKVYAAVAAEILFRSGMQLKDACKRVATDFSKAGHKHGKARNLVIEERTVKGWRSQCIGPGGERFKRVRFEFIIALQKAAGQWPMQSKAAGEFSKRLAADLLEKTL